MLEILLRPEILLGGLQRSAPQQHLDLRALAKRRAGFYTAALLEPRFDTSASHFGRCNINRSNRYQMDRSVDHFHSDLRADCL